MCGEKQHLQNLGLCPVGSPPRVRGKGRSRQKRGTGGRITPACAGKRTAQSERYARERDHPRVCGEKAQTVDVVRCAEGSPPRVRGKARPLEIGKECGGITPACAGKSWFQYPTWFLGGDHPRVCGEKGETGWTLPVVQGSPPRVRGKGLLYVYSATSNGITPACAGKRELSCLNVATQWDHPRVCGEKAFFSGKFDETKGSPPRVRGKAVKESRVDRC